MAMQEFRPKVQPVWAEKVEGDLVALAELAERWGAELSIPAGGEITLTLPPTVNFSLRTARVGDWLVQSAGSGKGACTDEEFQASFEAVEVADP